VVIVPPLWKEKERKKTRALGRFEREGGGGRVGETSLILMSISWGKGHVSRKEGHQKRPLYFYRERKKEGRRGDTAVEPAACVSYMDKERGGRKKGGRRKEKRKTDGFLHGSTGRGEKELTQIWTLGSMGKKGKLWRGGGKEVLIYRKNRREKFLKDPLFTTSLKYGEKGGGEVGLRKKKVKGRCVFFLPSSGGGKKIFRGGGRGGGVEKGGEGQTLLWRGKEKKGGERDNPVRP